MVFRKRTITGSQRTREEVGLAVLCRPFPVGRRRRAPTRRDTPYQLRFIRLNVHGRVILGSPDKWRNLSSELGGTSDWLFVGALLDLALGPKVGLAVRSQSPASRGASCIRAMARTGVQRVDCALRWPRWSQLGRLIYYATEAILRQPRQTACTIRLKNADE